MNLSLFDKTITRIILTSVILFVSHVTMNSNNYFVAWHDATCFVCTYFVNVTLKPCDDKLWTGLTFNFHALKGLLQPENWEAVPLPSLSNNIVCWMRSVMRRACVVPDSF